MTDKQLTAGGTGRTPARAAGPVRKAALAGAAFGLVMLLAAAILFGGGRRETVARPQIEGLVEQAARQLDAQTPFRLDATRTVLGVSPDGNRIVYRMRTSEDVPAEEIEAARARLEAASAEELCGGVDTRRMIDRGAIFEHHYVDASGDAFRTETGSCAGREAPGNSVMPVAM